jgi:hypothetical protein
MSMLQEKPSALKKRKFINFFLCLWVIFALPDPQHCSLIRVWMTEWGCPMVKTLSFISVLRHLPNVCVSRFEQKQTSVVSLLSLAGALFHQGRGRGSSNSCFSQLLIIVSDGRGIFHEGREKVTQVKGLVYATDYGYRFRRPIN